MSKCMIYGCKMNKCYCRDEEACIRIDCNACAKIACELPDSTIELAKKAVKALEERKNENIEDWAFRLAEEPSRLND